MRTLTFPTQQLRREHLTIVQTLLAIQSSVNSDKNCLLELCRSGNVEEVRALLEAGEEPNMPGANFETPLLLPIEGGHEEIVSMLWDYKASGRLKETYLTK